VVVHTGGGVGLRLSEVEQWQDFHDRTGSHLPEGYQIRCQEYQSSGSPAVVVHWQNLPSQKQE
jgi:hypothetical protein